MRFKNYLISSILLFSTYSFGQTHEVEFPEFQACNFDATVPEGAHAPQKYHDNEDLSKEEVGKILEEAGIKSEQVQGIVKLLADKFGTDREGRLRISGVLRAAGWNYSLFKDRKMWNFSADFKPANGHRTIHIPNLYEVEFFNGGFKVELAYKWIFLFIPVEEDIQSLDGAFYDRGLAVSVAIGGIISLEAGWLPGENRPGNIYYISPIVGLAGSVTFPKMIFKINPAAKLPQ